MFKVIKKREKHGEVCLPVPMAAKCRHRCL